MNGGNPVAVIEPVTKPRLTILHPPAEKARYKRRHLNMMHVFAAAVVLPFCLAAWYLFAVASDQFASTVGNSCSH